MARFVMGDDVISVCASGIGGSAAETDRRPHTALTVLRFAGGAIGTIDNSWLSTYGYDQRLEAFGPAGVVRVENEEAEPKAESRAPFFVQRYFESYVAEMATFTQYVLESGEPSASGADGRAAVVLAIAAQKSCREGRPVAVKEIG
jgi:myo-inositol 2-dehydrogenase / D-chiro-inositol 1-dehydrogenase